MDDEVGEQYSQCEEEEEDLKNRKSEQPCDVSPIPYGTLFLRFATLTGVKKIMDKKTPIFFLKKTFDQCC